MTTAIRTPFVSTPFGVGVVQGSVKKLTPVGEEVFVRFEDGSRRWLVSSDCEFDAEQPSWYVAPDSCDIPGYVR